MPLLSRLMIRSAFLCLLVGFTLGGLILSAKGGVVDTQVWVWLPVHIILLINGWMLQLSLGVAYWIMPRIRLAERGRRSYAWAGFAFFSVGNFLLILSLLRLWWSAMAQLTAPSIMLQMTGVGLLVFHLFPRVRPAMVRADEPDKPTSTSVYQKVKAARKGSVSTKPIKIQDRLLTALLTMTIVLTAAFGLSLLESDISRQIVEDTSIDGSISHLVTISSTDTSNSALEHQISHEQMHITIIGTEFHFEPDEFELKVGVPVELAFENRGTTEHDLVIKDIPIAESDDTDIRLYAWFGESASITFTPTLAGEYDIICSILGHKEAGMTGRVVVVE